MSKNGVDLDAQEAKLKEQLRSVQAAKKERDQKRHLLIGETVAKRMKGDSAFAAEIEKLLSDSVKSKRDRVVLGLDG